MVYLLMFMITPYIESQKKNCVLEANLITALIITSIAVSVTMAAKQQQQQKEAKKERQKELAKAEQLQLQAGEYWEELNLKQMALQQSENRFKTLADLVLLKVKKQKENQQIYTTPVTPPAEPTLIEKINKSIDKFLRG